MFPYEEPVDPADAGVNNRKLDHAVSLFRRQHACGAFPGGQLVVRRGGKLILNIVCGIARGLREKEGIPQLEVTPTTQFPALSAGKPLAAVAVAMLEEQGKLDVNAPVAEFIPEFSRHGKGAITVRDVLTHQAGISLPGLVAKPSIWNDRDAVLNALVNARPVHPRGTLMYAAYEYGWLLSEIFIRTAGQPLHEFIAQEISTQLDLPNLKYGLAGRKLEEIAYTYWLGKDKVIVSDINVAEGFEETNNSLEQINSMNPAVSLVTDAASLAGFYEFLVSGGVARTGSRLISAETIARYISSNISGIDRSSRMPMNLGRGFMLGSTLLSVFGWWGSQQCFGHGGGFSSLAFGDRKTKLAVAILSNGNKSFLDMARRFIPLAHRLRSACQ